MSTIYCNFWHNAKTGFVEMLKFIAVELQIASGTSVTALLVILCNNAEITFFSNLLKIVPLISNCSRVHIINYVLWLACLVSDIKKLSVVELKQLSIDLARAVVDYNNALRQELGMSDELKYENRLSKDFITLTLSIQRKRRQQEHLSSVAADEEVDLDVLTDSCTSGTVRSKQWISCYSLTHSLTDVQDRQRVVVISDVTDIQLLRNDYIPRCTYWINSLVIPPAVWLPKSFCSLCIVFARTNVSM